MAVRLGVVIELGTDEFRVNDEAAEALGTDPNVYQRGGMLVQVIAAPEPTGEAIRRPAGGPVVRELVKPLVRDRLTRVAHWREWRGGEDGGLVATHPPEWCVAAVHARGTWPRVRRLEAVVPHPVLLPDGTLLAESGYHDATGVLVTCPPDLQVVVPDAPSREDVATAVETLLDPLADFPFQTPAHRAAIIAGLLTPLAWFLFDGPAPLFLIDANVRAAGKGLLADVVSIVLTGRRFAVTAPTVIIAPPAGYSVDVPGGLAAPAGPGVPAPGPNDEPVNKKSDYLRCGENFTRSRSNPVVVWTATPAAVALAQVVEQFGRVVVFDPLTNLVTIQQLGTGTGLPAGRLLSDSPAIDLEAVPSEVIVRGGPTRYQVRLYAIAVGREWDGSWRPLDQLSYAPDLPAGKKMKTVSLIKNYSAAVDFAAVVNGVAFTVPTGSHSSAGTVYAALVLAINASVDPRISGVVTASMPTTALTIEASANGVEFSLLATPTARWKSRCTVGPIPDPTPQINEWQVTFTPPAGAWGVGDTVTITVGGTPYTSYPALDFDEAVANVTNQINGAAGVNYAAGNAGGGLVTVSGTAAGTSITVSASITSGDAEAVEAQTATSVARGFHRSPPGAFDHVKTTNQLNYQEVVSLAKASVRRCYQIVAVNPADPSQKFIPMPGGLDPITDVTLLQLLGSRVEQTAPRPGDANVVNTATGQPFAEDTYNGYSNDRPVAVYGSISVASFGSLWYSPEGGLGSNTAPTQRIHALGAQIVDAEWNVVRFDQEAYRYLGEGVDAVCLPTAPVIEIGVLVCDPTTFVPQRFSVSVSIPGATAPPVTRIFDDVRQEVIGEYDENHVLLRDRVNDADPENRATAYANAVVSNYQQPASETLAYNNMEGVNLSGIVRMVMWSFSASGFGTIASANTEFTRILLAYGERRRQENEPPNARRALENFLSQPAVYTLPLNTASAIGGILGGLASNRLLTPGWQW